MFGKDSILYLEHVPKELNKQVFECQAANDVGLSNKTSLELDVLCKCILWPFVSFVFTRRLIPIELPLHQSISTVEPQLIEQSGKESVKTGSDLNLLCQFDGNPKPTVSWIHYHPILEQVTLFKESDSNGERLQIKNVTYLNEGQYRCEARNIIFGLPQILKGNPIPVNVYGSPDFLEVSVFNQITVPS